MSQPASPNPLQPPQPSAPQSSSKKVILVPEPLKFDGNAKNYKAWIMLLEIYFAVHPKKFADDKKRTLAVLSCIQGGTTGLWAKVLLQVKLNAAPGTSDAVWFTWNDLKVWLTTTFKDHTTGQRAREKMENLQQGRHSIYKFFSLFKTLTVECSLMTNQKQLLYLLEKNVNEKIISQIINTQDPPKTYEAYRNTILCIS
jgi:hypothetical protein